MKKDMPAKLRPRISQVPRHATFRSKNFWMPIAARQRAKTIAVPAASSGSSESVITRNIASAAPAAAMNDEPVQNRAAANDG